MRISVVGASGAGKSTMARALARHLDAPCLELDALVHQPGWQRLDDDRFRAEVRRFCAQDRWVVDGNYSEVRDLVLDRATASVLLHPPRVRVMRRLFRRTVRRAITREELWNGNRENPLGMLSPNPETNVLLWSWTTYHRRASCFTAATADPRWTHVVFVRYTGDVPADRVLGDIRAAG